MSGTGTVSFDPVYFAARYPEFSSVAPSLLPAYFTEAGLLLNNSPCSIVQDYSIGGARYIWLHMLTAHLTFLYSGENNSTPSPLVGRINDATEGSVHVAAEMPDQPQAAAYFNQTKYGAEFWRQTAQYRTMHYQPGPNPPPICGAWGVPGYYGRGW